MLFILFKETRPHFKYAINRLKEVSACVKKPGLSELLRGHCNIIAVKYHKYKAMEESKSEKSPLTSV